MSKLLVEFHWDCGRQGDVNSLFVTTQDELDKTYGKQVCFGEILGKYSDVYGPLKSKNITIKSDDQTFIGKLVEVIGSTTISGYNPLSYLLEEEEEE